MLPSVSAALLLPLLVGCATDAPAPSTEPAPAADPSPTAKPPARLAYGSLAKVDGRWELHMAGSPVVEVPDAVATLAADAVGPDGRSAFALVEQQADGTVTGWRCVALEDRLCAPRSDGAPLALHGTEPFWGLRLAADTAAFTEPEAPDPVTFSVVAAGPSGPWTLVPTSGGASWTITAKPGACPDGMADAWYTFGVTIERGDASTLQGCAFDQRPPG